MDVKGAPTTGSGSPPATHAPFIPASTVLPEITLKGVLLGLVLAVVLGAANAFAGMRVGLTVSASIPAAVVSLGVLRLFKNSNILENNIVQTTASAGQSVAAGIIFTIPALLITGVWTEVRLLETFLIAGLGGTLGVLFTIPLRRALIVEAALPFPEGAACAEVLKAGDREGAGGGRFLFGAMVLGALYSFLQLGLGLWAETIQGARRVADTVAYAGTNMAPILLGVGYIVGLRIASLIFIGGVLSWFILIPAFLWIYGWPAPSGADLPALDAARQMWTSRIRLVAGGAMITGGLITLWRLRSTLRSAAKEGIASVRGGARADTRIRTERDLGMRFVVWGIVVLSLPLFLVYWRFTGDLVQAVVATFAMAL
ncbi:MAG: OPT family oligopeptide transporter, partial [Methanobacteriota archaeon]